MHGEPPRRGRGRPRGTTFTYADDDQIAEARSDDWVHRFVHGPAGVLSSETITNLADGTSYEVTREWGEAGAPVGARLPGGRTVRYTPTADGEGERVALGEGVELACEYGPAGELVGIAAGAVRVRREGLLLGAAIADRGRGRGRAPPGLRVPLRPRRAPRELERAGWRGSDTSWRCGATRSAA